MRSQDSHGDTTNKLLFWLGALIVLLLDYTTKTLIRTRFEVGESLGIINRVENTGVAFGMLKNMNWVFAIIAAVVIILLILHRNSFSPSGSALGAGLVLGGAAGNLVDRVVLGAVTDFVSLGWWPAFNVADAGLSVGVLMLAFYWRD